MTHSGFEQALNPCMIASTVHFELAEALLTYLSKPDRRRTILDAATAVMLRDGFTHMTTRAVAAEMGAANGIIHHHFKSAADLKQEAFRHYVEMQCAAFDAARSGLATADALRLFTEDFTREDHYPQMRLWGEAWTEAQSDEGLAVAYGDAFRAWSERLSTLIEAGAKEGILVSPPDMAMGVWRILLLGIAVSGMSKMPAGLFGRETGRLLMAGAMKAETGFDLG